MNDELMCLFFRLEYAVQTMRRRQKTAKKHGKEWQLPSQMKKRWSMIFYSGLKRHVKDHRKKQGAAYERKYGNTPA